VISVARGEAASVKKADFGRVKGPPNGSGLPDAERQELARSHLPLVRAIARRYAGRGEELDDLVQAGSVGLVRASARFDPGRGVAFATFAAPAVEGAVRRHLSQRSHRVRAARGAEGATSDSPAAEASDAPVEQSREPAHLAESEYRILLAGGLRALDERERRIVFLRFHADMTERQIAQAVGISQAHVSRLLHGALTKLRAEFSSADSANTADITKSPAISRRKVPEIAGPETRIDDVGADKESVGAQPDEVARAGNRRTRKPGYSGRFLVRMPSELHERLAHAAERQEISLNRYVTDALSSSVGVTSSDGMDPQAGTAAGDPGNSSGRVTPRTLRMAVATNVAVVVLAGVVAVVLLVLAVQRGL
jgi:RNA polymerase sigma-B factor